MTLQQKKTQPGLRNTQSIEYLEWHTLGFVRFWLQPSFVLNFHISPIRLLRNIFCRYIAKTASSFFILTCIFIFTGCANEASIEDLAGQLKVDALREHAKSQLRKQGEIAASQLLEILRRDLDPNIAEAISEISNNSVLAEKTVETIIQSLGQSNLSEIAVDCLGRMGSNKKVVSQMIYAENIGDNSGVMYVARRYRKDVPRKVFRRIVKRRALAPLIQLATKTIEYTKEEGLVFYGKPRTYYLKEHDVGLRAKAIAVLGDIGNLDAVNPLASIAENASYNKLHRQYAVTALGEIGGREAKGILVNLLRNAEDMEFKEAVNKALQRVNPRDLL